jgi:hypothetical protein
VKLKILIYTILGLVGADHVAFKIADDRQSPSSACDGMETNLQVTQSEHISSNAFRPRQSDLPKPQRRDHNDQDN